MRVTINKREKWMLKLKRIMLLAQFINILNVVGPLVVFNSSICITWNMVAAICFIESIDLIRLPFICSLDWKFIIILQDDDDGFWTKMLKMQNDAS